MSLKYVALSWVIIEGSLEVKLLTCGLMQQQVWEESEKREREGE